MPDPLNGAIGVLGTLIGGGGLWAYVTARRTRSGKVATTDAEVLWAESRQIREGQRTEIERLRTDVASLQTEMQTLRQQVYKLVVEADTLRDGIARRDAELAIRDAEIARLRSLHGEK